jgi:hypothetical protein
VGGYGTLRLAMKSRHLLVALHHEPCAWRPFRSPIKNVQRGRCKPSPGSLPRISPPRPRWLGRGLVARRETLASTCRWPTASSCPKSSRAGPRNSAFRKRYPIEAIPSFYVVDPEEQVAKVRWIGGLTITQLHALLDTYSIANDLQVYDGDHVNRIHERLTKHLMPFFAAHLSSR